MDAKLKVEGFEILEIDPNLYVKRRGTSVVTCVVYVDDLIISGNRGKAIAEVKSNLGALFDMTDLGKLHYFLGI